MKHVNDYLKRSFTLMEMVRVDAARRALRGLALMCKGGYRYELRISNRQDNGLVITLDEHGVSKADRSVNLKWAREHGYRT